MQLKMIPKYLKFWGITLFCIEVAATREKLLLTVAAAVIQDSAGSAAVEEPAAAHS